MEAIQPTDWKPTDTIRGPVQKSLGIDPLRDLYDLRQLASDTTRRVGRDTGSCSFVPTRRKPCIPR